MVILNDNKTNTFTSGDWARATKGMNVSGYNPVQTEQSSGPKTNGSRATSRQNQESNPQMKKKK